MGEVAVSSLYQVVFTAVGAGQVNNPLINSFTYVSDSPAPSTPEAAQLADVFHLTVLQATGGWQDIVSSVTVGTSVVVTSPFLETVLAVKTFTITGTRSATVMPRFVTWTFESPRTRADIRKGRKAFGMCAEADVAGDVPTPTFVATLEGFTELLSEVLDTSVGASTYASTPAIVKRIKYITEGGKEAYRLPTSELELAYSPATNWVFQSVSSQNSRKA